MTDKEKQDKKTLKVIEKIVKVLNDNPLTITQLLVLYGNLGYRIGASMASIEGTGPSTEELKKEYYTDPTVDTGLMLQGLLITSWEEDFLKQPKLSKWAINKKKEEKGE